MAANTRPTYRAQLPGRPAWLHAAVAISSVLVLIALYLVAMRLAIAVSDPNGRYSPNERDAIYFWLHLGGVAVSLVGGFVLGRWLNGMGLAYAVLLAVCLAVAMVGAQVGSQALECHGRDGVIRHWTC